MGRTNEVDDDAVVFPLQRWIHVGHFEVWFILESRAQEVKFEFKLSS